MHKHIKTCAAVGEVTDKYWSTAWAYAEQIWADSHGNRHSDHPSRNTSMWLKVICNDPSCKAYLMIRMDDFMKELPQT